MGHLAISLLPIGGFLLVTNHRLKIQLIVGN